MPVTFAQKADQDVMTKVAVVEDNATFRVYLANLINNTANHRCVCTCASTEDALAEIPGYRPDIVLMDIHMPGESGIVCTARLREKLPNLQIIMLTVYKDMKVIFNALKAGACGYLLKRSDDKEIMQAIAEVRAGGAPMTGQVARLVVRSFMESQSSSTNETDRLSGREMEVLALVAKGRANKEIASYLSISEATVRAHLMHIYEKLHVHSRTEAAAKYLLSAPRGAVTLNAIS
jgi:DNA-binding NarL/FixJ family response regulator